MRPIAMRRRLAGVLTISLLAVAGCGSSDELASKASDVALARLGAQQSIQVVKPLKCEKRDGGGSTTTYQCSGEVTVGSSVTPQSVSVSVICVPAEKRCIQ